MCLRNLSLVIVVLALMIYACNAHKKPDGSRLKRNDTDSTSGDSQTVGQLISSWLTNLFGNNTSLTDVASQPMNDSTKAALQSFLSNVSQSGTPGNGNDITTTSKQETVASTTDTVAVTTSEYDSSTTWTTSSTSYPPEDEKCYTDAVFQVQPN